MKHKTRLHVHGGCNGYCDCTQGGIRYSMVVWYTPLSAAAAMKFFVNFISPTTFTAIASSLTLLLYYYSMFMTYIIHLHNTHHYISRHSTVDTRPSLVITHLYGQLNVYLKLSGAVLLPVVSLLFVYILDVNIIIIIYCVYILRTDVY